MKTLAAAWCALFFNGVLNGHEIEKQPGSPPRDSVESLANQTGDKPRVAQVEAKAPLGRDSQVVAEGPDQSLRALRS